MHEQLIPLHRALFADASPSPTKYALNKLQPWFASDARLPIVECSEAAKRAVDEALEIAGLR